MQNHLDTLKQGRIMLDRSIIETYGILMLSNFDKSKGLRVLKAAKKCNCSTSRVYKALQFRTSSYTGSAEEQPVGVQ